MNYLFSAAIERNNKVIFIVTKTPTYESIRLIKSSISVEIFLNVDVNTRFLGKYIFYVQVFFFN